MVFGFSGRDHDSQNQWYLILGKLRRSNKYKKHIESFWRNIVCWNIKMLDIANVWFLEKTWVKHPEGPSNTFRKSWTWDRNLPKSMHWKFGNLGSISSEKHFMKLNMWRLGYFQLKEFKQLKTICSFAMKGISPPRTPSIDYNGVLLLLWTTLLLVTRKPYGMTPLPESFAFFFEALWMQYTQLRCQLRLMRVVADCLQALANLCKCS